MQLTTFLAVVPLLSLALAGTDPTTVSTPDPTTLATSVRSTPTGHSRHVKENTCRYIEKDNKYHFHILGLKSIDQETLEKGLKVCGNLDDIKFKHLSKKRKHNWKATCTAPNKVAEAGCVADQLNKLISGSNQHKIECKEHKAGHKKHKAHKENKENKESKENKENKESKENKENKDHSEDKDHKEDEEHKQNH